MKKKQGRQIVHFPIIRTEVVHGHSIRHVIEENTTVRCIRCGRGMKISGGNVYTMDASDMQLVQCPKCKYACAVVYYYNQIN